MASKHVHRAIALSILSLCTLVSAVVPPEELEATKPQVELHKEGDNLRFDWEAHPEVYYFFEGSPNLEDWITAKLLKDNDASGQLSLGTAVSGSKGFYRLSLEGDPDAQRLREDSDGDNIINLLEAEADWDAFLTNTSADNDADGIPDYFEEFHFDTLDHDGDYIATTGGLTLTEAYSNATNPNSTDSDGDGWTDRQELTWGWDTNYDQSREDTRYDLLGDFDGDGYSNQSEAMNNTDPTDSESYPEEDSVDYALIDIGVAEEPYRDQYGRPFYGISENGHVVYESPTGGMGRWFWGALSFPEIDFYPDIYTRTDDLSVTENGDVLFMDFAYGASFTTDNGSYVEGIEFPTEYCVEDEIYSVNDDEIMMIWRAPSQQVEPIVPILEILRFWKDGSENCNYVSDFYRVSFSSDGSYAITDQGHLIQLSDKEVVSATEIGQYIDHMMINNNGDFIYYDSQIECYKLNETTLNLDVLDLDDAGRVLGTENGKFKLLHGSSTIELFDFETGYYNSKNLMGHLNDQLIVTANHKVYFQQRDPVTGELTPLSSTDAMHGKTVEEMVYGDVPLENPEWTNLRSEGISRNGKYIIVSGTKNGELHLGMLLKVDLDIDASTPSASKLNFSVPDNVPICKATLLRGNDTIGWIQEDEKLNLIGSGFLTFDQNFIGILEFDENNSPIDRDLRLELTIAGTLIEFPINADRVDSSKDAVELITGFWIDVGTRIFNHTIRETYSDYVYSVPASGKLRKLLASFASVDLGSSQFTAGTESHKYNPDGGPSQNMSSQSGLGVPNTAYWTIQSNLWIDTSETTINEGVCTNSGISVFTGTGPALGGSTNNSVDVTID